MRVNVLPSYIDDFVGKYQQYRFEEFKYCLSYFY